MERSIFNYILNISNVVDIIKLLFYVAIVIIFVIYVYFNWNYDANEKSIEIMNHNREKYIKDIYVELGNTKECLRYFFYKEKWKKKLKNEIINLLDNKANKLLFERCEVNVNKINSINDMENTLTKCISYLENKEKNSENVDYYIEMNKEYKLDEKLELLKVKARLMKSNVCLVKGKAGTGKTNLLYDFIRYVACNNRRNIVIFLNAKDINCEIEQYINKEYPLVDNKILNKFSEISIIGLSKIFFMKKFWIIIDGINESPTNSFYYDLCKFINKIRFNKRINVILSTREEYYEYRCKKIFDNILLDRNMITEVYISNEQNERSREQFFEKYKIYFNFNGIINNHIKKEFIENPLFARIFFETNSGSKEKYSIIDRNSIFDKYINTITNDLQIKRKDIEHIAEYMIDNKKYSNISIDVLKIDRIVIDKLIDTELLITKNLISNKKEPNIKTEEVISFVFDEMRDYLISNILIERHNNGLININNYIKEIYKEKAEIMEGIIRNTYTYYKNKENVITKNILIINKYERYRNSSFINANISLIFDSKKEINLIESRYLDNIGICMHDLYALLLECGYNEIYGYYPSSNYISGKIMDYINGHLVNNIDFSELKRIKIEEIITNLLKENNNKESDYIILLKMLRDKIYE